eukprot:CAMPEP_0119407540 /NCGR_PEP_ID=MMETSP1335-20130426/1387_1 /TAXON_ID=259385 /ORGANISM="Chrysoculter rhomboideus, Strain RCC1486" /LENGTH=265 /DNA_ID=CAMNT_0007431661 /DNA_START=33 /DNA_END=830 /DNA_ORIENTATION=+
MAGMMQQAALNDAMLGVTQDAVVRNVERDLEAAAAQEAARRAGVAGDEQLEHTEEAIAAASLAERGDDGDDDDDEFDEDDPALRALEQRRIAQMKAMHAKRMVNQAKGHGDYREIVEEEFLKECTSSARVVVHFFHADFARCKIIDKHLRLIAPKHDTCKFLTINADKAPFFVTKLAIRTLPTLLIFHDGVCKDRIVGFEELGGEDDFPTRMLEVRLHTAGAILLSAKKKKKGAGGREIAHNGTYSDDDDDSEGGSDDDDDDDEE